MVVIELYFFLIIVLIYRKQKSCEDYLESRLLDIFRFIKSPPIGLWISEQSFMNLRLKPRATITSSRWGFIVLEFDLLLTLSSKCYFELQLSTLKELCSFPNISARIETEIPAWGFAFLQQWQARATNGSSLPDI